MIQVVLGSLLLSVIHTLIPNHWIPLVAIGKAQRWARSQTLLMAGIMSIAHASSTVLIGILVGLLGHRLSATAVMTSMVPAAILMGLGIIYLVLDSRTRHEHHHHEHETPGGEVSKLSIVAPLSVAMFFSPCIEIEAYYFTAGSWGWRGIIAVSLVYSVVTVLGSVALVDLGLKGTRRIRSHYLEQHEKRVTGLVLVALGLMAYLVEF